MSTSAQKLNNLQVLLIEDEAVTRTALTVLLENQGAIVIAVGSVKEGLEVLERFSPNILLSNMRLPDGIGASVLRRLRDRDIELQQHTPAIALTGEALELVRADPALSGFEMYMSKPFDSEALVTAIVNLID